MDHLDRGRTADLIVPFDHIDETRVGRDLIQADPSGGRIGLRIQRRRSPSPSRPRPPRRRDRARAGGRQRACNGTDGGTPEDRPRGPALVRAGEGLLTVLAFRSTRQFGPVGQVRRRPRFASTRACFYGEHEEAVRDCLASGCFPGRDQSKDMRRCPILTFADCGSVAGLLVKCAGICSRDQGSRRLATPPG